MNAFTEAVLMEVQDDPSALARARLYRFRTSERATVALLLYATALGIDRREARQLAGLPVGPLSNNPRGRLTVAAGLAATALVILLPPHFHGASTSHAAGRALPPPWRISVEVLNGGGDITYTRRVADRIGSFAYQIKKVSRAGRFDYPETSVYFPPGGEGIGQRLANQLGVTARPLPGGKNARRLVVIVGPPRAPRQSGLRKAP